MLYLIDFVHVVLSVVGLFALVFCEAYVEYEV
jgi:hypothetical protein